jgi:hypothetical protein
LRSVGDQSSTETVEHLDRQAARVLVGLDHDRRHRADQHRLGNASRAMAAEIMGDFAAAGGVSDMHCILEVELCGERRYVVGIGVHFVAGSSLRRAAVAAPVMRDDAVAVVQEEQHLVVPIVGAERPAVMEYDRLASTPVLVEYLGTVSGSDGRHGHVP